MHVKVLWKIRGRDDTFILYTLRKLFFLRGGGGGGGGGILFSRCPSVSDTLVVSKYLGNAVMASSQFLQTH